MNLEEVCIETGYKYDYLTPAMSRFCCRSALRVAFECDHYTYYYLLYMTRVCRGGKMRRTAVTICHTVELHIIRNSRSRLF